MPAVIPTGPSTGYSVSCPSVVMRPTLFARSSVNQSAPSGPAMIRFGKAPAASWYSVKCPSSVIRPTFAAARPRNQIAPSGPSAPLCVVALGVGTGMSIAAPVVGSNRASAFDPCSVT